MDSRGLIDLLSQNAAVLREDLSHIEAGNFKFYVFGVDATDEQAERLRGNLSRLEQIIASLQDAPNVQQN